MERDDLIHKLRSLAQLDTDAVAVYADALKHVTDPEVKTAFEQFQGEHRYHAEQLGDTIQRLEGAAPTLDVDLAGHLAEWMTSARSQRGTNGALHAMQTAEHYHNRRYDEAVEWDIAVADLAKMLGRFDSDERRHLAFIEARLGKTANGGAPE